MAQTGLELHDLQNGRVHQTPEATEPAYPTRASYSRLGTDSLARSDYYDRDDDMLRLPTGARHDLNDSRSSISFQQVPSEVTALAESLSAEGEEQPEPLTPKSDAEQYRRPKKPSSIFVWWVPELIASALSVASFASIVIVLLVYDRCAVARLGMPSGLTLNGIIALLATVGRVCLCAPVCSALLQEMWLYLARESKRSHPKSRLRDLELFFNASYGTVGSLQFLARASSTKLVSGAGCLIMIVSLVFGTFVQQLVAYEVLSARGSEPLGNIPRSEEWVTLDSTSFDPTVQMTAAIYDGVLSGNVPPIPPSCPSGNCTWPTTPSLAICGECEARDFSLVNCYDPSGGTYYVAKECCDSDDSVCNYTLASGNSGELWNAAKYPAILTGNAPGFNALMGGLFDPKRESLYLVDLFGFPYGAGRLQSPTAAYHQCSLWMCIQHLNASVESGQYHQQVIAVNNHAGSWIQKGEEVWSTFGPLEGEAGFGQGLNYTASSGAVSAVKMFFALKMYGSANVSSTDTGTYTNDLIRGIWNGTADVDSWIENVATSMTNVLRSNTTQPQRPEYDGTQFELAVRVRWLWIILPASLVLSSILFMATVMIRTAHSPVRSWKGSPLTMLLLELDPAVRDVASERMEEHNGVEKAVGMQTVRLVRRANGRRSLVAV